MTRTRPLGNYQHRQLSRACEHERQQFFRPGMVSCLAMGVVEGEVETGQAKEIRPMEKHVAGDALPN